MNKLSLVQIIQLQSTYNDYIYVYVIVDFLIYIHLTLRFMFHLYDE